MPEPIPADADPQPGDEVIYEYEHRKLIEAHVLRAVTPKQFEIRIPPAKHRWAIPLTAKGTWEDGAVLVAPRSALRRFNRQQGFDEGEDGTAGVPD